MKYTKYWRDSGLKDEEFTKTVDVSILINQANIRILDKNVCVRENHMEFLFIFDYFGLLRVKNSFLSYPYPKNAEN